MEKRILLILAVLIFILNITSCNKGMVDFNMKFDYAILSLPNGEIVEGEIEKWWDYEEGDQIQVRINGNTYLVHSEDVVLIKKGAEQ